MYLQLLQVQRLQVHRRRGGGVLDGMDGGLECDADGAARDEGEAHDQGRGVRGQQGGNLWKFWVDVLMYCLEMVKIFVKPLGVGEILEIF